MRKARSIDWRALRRGSHVVVYRYGSCSSRIPPMPPRHSVTSSPVSSMCTPPGHVFSASCTAKKPWISPSTSSKRRVLRPRLAHKGVAVHRVAHPATGWRRGRHGPNSGGRESLTLSTPMRVDEAEPAGLAVGVQALTQRQRLVRRRASGRA